MVTKRRKQRMLRVLLDRQRDLTVICENIHDPHNVSAILRTCDAVGISKVHLLYTNEAFPKLGKKSSASAKKWLEFQRHKDYNNLRDLLKAQKMTIYATHVDPSSQKIFEVDWTQPAAILMGNEHRGVSEQALKIADKTIYIPMHGMVQSLNVSVAAAVLLYEAYRQRLQKQMYPYSTGDRWVDEHFSEWAGENLKLKTDRKVK
jgi:tRNA (guanosine-2'-O-)-methyltransferase